MLRSGREGMFCRMVGKFADGAEVVSDFVGIN